MKRILFLGLTLVGLTGAAVLAQALLPSQDTISGGPKTSADASINAPSILNRPNAVDGPDDEAARTYTTSADRFLMIDGARVRVRVEGPLAGPVLILLHGFTYSLESFDAVAQELAREYRVIRYDLLGHGLTGADPKERYAPKERAAFIGEVMDVLGVERATIVGNSLGGLAAWRFAAQSAGRVNALVLIAAAAFPYNGVTETPAPIPDMMRLYLKTAPKPGIAASTALIWGDDSAIPPATVDRLHAMLAREGAGEAMLRSLEKFTLPAPEADLAAITAPTLILWGESDLVVPMSQGKGLDSAIANSQLVTYPGVGHVPHEEAPAQVIRDIRAFLARIGIDKS
ncbi:MAG: alpha/beta hydrolase [Pseudomonadota bacterium]